MVATDIGAVFLFERAGTVWSEGPTLVASGAVTDDMLGYNLALAGDKLVVAAEGADRGATDSGAVYVFDRTGTTWNQMDELTAPTPYSEPNLRRQHRDVGEWERRGDRRSRRRWWSRRGVRRSGTEREEALGSWVALG